MEDAAPSGEEGTRERERHRSRWLSVVVDDDGTYIMTGRLTPEAGVALQRALAAAEEALYRRDRSEEGVSAEPPSHRQALRAAGHWRQEALGLVAEQALAAARGKRPGKRQRPG